MGAAWTLERPPTPSCGCCAVQPLDGLAGCARLAEAAPATLDWPKLTQRRYGAFENVGAPCAESSLVRLSTGRIRRGTGRPTIVATGRVSVVERAATAVVGK